MNARVVICLFRHHDWRFVRPVNAKQGDPYWECARCGGRQPLVTS